MHTHFHKYQVLGLLFRIWKLLSGRFWPQKDKQFIVFGLRVREEKELKRMHKQS